MLLTVAVARKWPEVNANAVDPGWVPTKMGGLSAPDNLEEGVETQVWLAIGKEDKAQVSGRYFHHQKEAPYRTETKDTLLQEKYLALCERITELRFPR